MLKMLLAAAATALSCGCAVAQTVTCVDRDFADKVYSRVQIERTDEARTFRKWSIRDGREQEPVVYEVPTTSVLKNQDLDWSESDDGDDYEHMLLDLSGYPWFLIVDYELPLIIYGGYGQGMDDPLIRFDGDDCTVSD